METAGVCTINIMICCFVHTNKKKKRKWKKAIHQRRLNSGTVPFVFYLCFSFLLSFFLSFFLSYFLSFFIQSLFITDCCGSSTQQQKTTAWCSRPAVPLLSSLWPTHSAFLQEMTRRLTLQWINARVFSVIWMNATRQWLVWEKKLLKDAVSWSV